MNKEAILEQSRKQNKNMDLYEQQVIAKGTHIGFSVGIFIAALLFAIEEFVNRTQNYGLIGVWTSMEAVMYIYKYVKLRKSYDLVFAIIFSFCALCFIILQILTITGIIVWVK